MRDIDYSLGWDLEFDSKTWKDVKPISITHFQGFKYLTSELARKIEVL